MMKEICLESYILRRKFVHERAEHLLVKTDMEFDGVKEMQISWRCYFPWDQFEKIMNNLSFSFPLLLPLLSPSQQQHLPKVVKWIPVNM